MQDIAREALVNVLDAMKPELQRKGVVHLALFGSRARRDNRQDSDIDLLIDVDEQREFSLIDLVGVAQDIQDRVGLPANLFMRRSLDPGFLAEASTEQIAVF